MTCLLAVEGLVLGVDRPRTTVCTSACVSLVLGIAGRGLVEPDGRVVLNCRVLMG
jgi:hypothetical protein